MREILLTQGKVALVDDEDFEEISKYKWHVNNDGYATRNYWLNQKCYTIRLHRLITKAKSGDEVDHINLNKLDDRKSNLRICSLSENRRNRTIKQNNTSGYKGISFCPEKKKNQWSSRIGINGKRICLGHYGTKKEAAQVYNNAAIKYHGEFARLNKI